jgi:hypothetical protein
MPGTIPQSEIMQPARDFHHHVTDTVLPIADFVLHDTTAFHTADGVLYPHFLARNATVLFFLFRREFSTTWLLRWLSNRYCRNGKSLKPHILIEDTVSRQTIGFIINNGFFMPFSCMRWAQVLDPTCLSNQQDVFYGVAFLLSTIIFLLFIRVYRSLDRAFGAIMVKKGGLSEVSVLESGLIVAVREGSAPSCCKAPCTTGRSSCNHLFATDCRIPNRRPCTSCVRFCFIWTRINNSLSSMVGNDEFLYAT